MSIIDEIKDNQENFIHICSDLIKQVKSTHDFKSGNSDAYNTLINNFNQKVRPLMQTLLESANTASNQNVILEVQLKNSETTLAAYKNSFIVTAKSCSSQAENFRSLYKLTAELCTLYNESLNEVASVAALKKENEELRKQQKAYQDYILLLKGNYDKLVNRESYIKDLMEYKASILAAIDSKKNQIQEIEALKEENTKLKEDIETRDNKTKLLTSKMLQIKEQLVEKDTKIDQLNADLQAMETKLKETQTQLEETEKQKEKMKGAASFHLKKCKKLEAENQRLNDLLNNKNAEEQEDSHPAPPVDEPPVIEQRADQPEENQKEDENPQKEEENATETKDTEPITKDPEPEPKTEEEEEKKEENKDIPQEEPKHEEEEAAAEEQPEKTEEPAEEAKNEAGNEPVNESI